MEDRESGNLSQKPVLDLLVELYQDSVTGSLKLERAPLQKAVYFRDGQILFAASNDPKDQLASILVEEGKLGPDQMQVAQARVQPGNPLAKVLTELGYISQRELADAARIKVEKILTDLYSWKEGTYQFATKSLPKGAIDLELSTPRLIFASIRRIQDREWVLKQLGSLDAVLAPGPNLEGFIKETRADAQAVEVLRLADGVKTVKQIGSVSSLGEFEVCKILAAAIVVKALEAGSGAAVAAEDDSFTVPQTTAFEPPPPEPEPPMPESTAFNETAPVPTSPPPPDPPPPAPSDTVFEPPDSTMFEPAEEESERTVFEPPPAREPPPTGFPTGAGSSASTRASELLIDEPEPDTSDELPARRPPRPKRMRGGASRGSGEVFKWAGAVALMGAAAFSVYYFVWPLVAGGDDGGGSAAAPGSPTASVSTSAPATTSTPQEPVSSPPPEMPATPSTATAGAGPASPEPSTPPVTTTTAAPDPEPAVPPPPTTAPPRARALLQSGNYAAAANAFLEELEGSSADKFTIAVGLYCNEENVGRLVSNARGSSELYLLPTTVQGRRCYRVVWGLFDSRQSAERDIRSIPSGIRGGDAAAVPIAPLLR